MATRWGMCGTGLISHDFTCALKSLPESEHTIVAVGAASSREKAEAFAKEHGIPKAYGSYEDLAKDPDVEIVYVGTFHPYHYKACLLFLDHGKHVLCEKPLTLSLQHAQELVEKARQKKLFFMEGFWTRFFPAVKLLRQELEAGSVGKVSIVRAAFCSPTARLERMRKRELGGGALMGSGCYLIQFADLIFRERPQKIVALGQLSDEGVDTGAAIILTYSEGRMAVLCYNNGSVLGNNTLTVHGSKANMELHSPFHCPTTITLPSGETKVFPLPETPYTYNWDNSNGFVYEAQCVRQCLQQGLTECPEMPHEDSLNIMAILDEVRHQIGVVYDNLVD